MNHLKRSLDIICQVFTKSTSLPRAGWAKFSTAPKDFLVELHTISIFSLHQNNFYAEVATIDYTLKNNGITDRDILT